MAQMENSSQTACLETPGQQLRAARERAGLSLEELAQQLNLLRSFLSALEEDRYDRLPGTTFARGYLRNYARALKLDETALLAQFDALMPALRPTAVEPLPAPRYRPIALDSRGPRRHWSAAAALLVVLGLWGWQEVGERSPELVSLTPESGGVTVDLPGGLDEAQPSVDNPLDSVELLPPVPTELLSSADAAEQPGDTAATADRLNLRFSADCWVEIKDRDNKVLVAALKRADEQLQIEGRGPFKVLLGFAPGVEMAYNGRPVDIDVPSGARSARLIVGSS
jgi:cytoskeleton protein RodZ